MRTWTQTSNVSLESSNPQHSAAFSPASLALVSATVWNHIGKLYMTVKLHVATRKLLTPTSTGIFSANRKGARIGSGAMRSSTYTKTSAKTIASVKGT